MAGGDAMKNTIDLSVFTRHPVNPKYANPWSIGQYSYATDGRMAVRVPRIDEYQDNPILNFAAEAIDEWATYTVEAWYNVSPCNAPQDQTCPQCNGMKCVMFCPSPDEYHFDCKICNGDGYIPVPPGSVNGIICDECDGLGTVYPDFNEKHRVEYGNALFSTILLSRLSIFHNVMIGPRGVTNHALLKFDEGMGIIMPMWKQYE